MPVLPIVVVGAGPTGLMCALALASQNIPVIVLESEPALTHDLRAGTFHPPTLEMMAQFDLDLLAALTPYPYRLHLEQHRLISNPA
jgi:3-(3-hydroxy-phenyl)propionate hydroxylase